MRLENASSIRGRFKSGYLVVGYDRKQYGEFEAGGARLIMEKRLLDAPNLFDPNMLSTEFIKGNIPMVNEQNFELLFGESSAIGIPVSIGNEIDIAAHVMIEKAIEIGGVGIGLLKANECTDLSEKKSVLVFKKKSGL